MSALGHLLPSTVVYEFPLPGQADIGTHSRVDMPTTASSAPPTFASRHRDSDRTSLHGPWAETHRPYVMAERRPNGDVAIHCYTDNHPNFKDDMRWLLREGFLESYKVR